MIVNFDFEKSKTLLLSSAQTIPQNYDYSDEEPE